MKILSFLLRLVAVLLLSGIVILRASISEKVKSDPFFADNLGYIIAAGIVLTGFGAWLFRFARKLTAKTWEQIARNDPRPPVLYLRSFKIDPKGEKVSLDAWWSRFMYVASAIPANQTTQEEQLQLAFHDIGPMLTIAKPDSLLNPLGAARIKYSNEEWQERVAKDMQAAGLVLIRVGEDTEGLKWEIEHVFGKKEPSRILFLLPRSQKDCDSFFRMLQGIIKKEIPAYTVDGTVSDFSGLLYFGGDGKPMIEGFRNSFSDPTAQTFNHISIAIKKALQKINFQALATTRYERATFTERIKAFLYDLAIVVPLCLVIAIALVLGFHQSGPNSLAGAWIIAFFIIQFFYPFFAELYSVKGTFGKRRLGLHLADKEHIRPTAQQLFIRQFTRVLSFFPILIISVPYTLFAWYKNRPLLHDLFSRTRWFRSR